MHWRWCSCILLVCAAEQHLAADELSLVQKSVDGPSSASWQIVDPTSGLVKATKAHALQKQAAVSMAASRGLKRLMNKFNATKQTGTMVNMLKWSLTGKLTEWVTGFYREPKEASELTAVDSLLTLLTRAFDEKAQDLSDQELLSRILDWSQLHHVAHEYGVAEGELPEVMLVVDAVGEALEDKKPKTLSEARKAITEALSDTADTPMVGLMKYCFDLLAKKEKRNIDTLMFKLEPALREAGVPESAVSFITDTLDGVRNGEKVGVTEMITRTSYALAEASADLNMPPAFEPFWTTFGTFVANPDIKNATYFIYKVSDLAGLLGNVVKELGLPMEIYNIPRLTGRCIIKFGESKKGGSTDWDLFDLVRCPGPILANISLALGQPPAYAEFLNFTISNLHDPQLLWKMDNVTRYHQELKRAELLVKMLGQVGFPAPFVNYVKSFLDQVWSFTYGEDTPEKQKQRFRQALRFLGAPSLSNMLETIPALKGKGLREGNRPDPEVLFKLFVGAIDLPGDISRLRSVARRVHNRLDRPIIHTVGASWQNLSSAMPESFMKRLISRTARKMI